MRYLAKEFGSAHPQIDRFVQAARNYLSDGTYAVYGLVIRDTEPNKDDLELTSDSLIADVSKDYTLTCVIRGSSYGIFCIVIEMIGVSPAVRLYETQKPAFG